ncbi:MAG: M14 family zinc carboxypeptidase [Anaerolineaceae bacterium]
MHKRLNILLACVLCLLPGLARPLPAFALPPAPQSTLPDFPCYRDLATLYADAAALASAYPALATWTDIGDSWEKTQPGGAPGYDLFALRLTNSTLPGEKPALILVSGTHARDLAPVELNLRFAEYLLAGYGSDQDLTWLLDSAEVHIILSANPDGRAVVEAQIASGEADEFGDTARKKNLNNTACPDPILTGVDLDRNFSFQWQLGPDGCMSDYPGAAAASEPETNALIAYLENTLEDYRAGGPDEPADPNARGLLVHLQSYGNKVFYPYSYRSEPAPEDAALQMLANKFAYGTPASPAKYSGTYASFLPGSLADYVYGERGVPALAYMLFANMDGRYFTRCSVFGNSLSANLQALTRALKTVWAPYIFPAGPEMTPLLITVHHSESETWWELWTSADTNMLKDPDPNAPPVASAVYSFDLPPWEPGAVLHALPTQDGAFDSPQEQLHSRLDFSGLEPGWHRVFAQAFLADGTPGLAAAQSVLVPEPPPTTPYSSYLPILLR